MKLMCVIFVHIKNRIGLLISQFVLSRFLFKFMVSVEIAQKKAAYLAAFEKVEKRLINQCSARLVGTRRINFGRHIRCQFGLLEANICVI
ncbi:hypothetical protein DFP79_2517 [Marinomonas balearica]|uniref:Uncharacterized protein n=1 Tax=Marinomonas balearica TaxID=491947 RepID=A0A4R6M999_9GAMM|nr:hypothetical protein DFP79_2517 [Marinomonas balearica]